VRAVAVLLQRGVGTSQHGRIGEGVQQGMVAAAAFVHTADDGIDDAQAAVAD
jgi:hypothetical protein